MNTTRHFAFAHRDICILAVLYILLFGIHLFMKPFTDDLYYIDYTNAYGVGGLVSGFYETWSGRIVGNALSSAIITYCFWLWRILNPVVILLCAGAMARVARPRVDRRVFLLSFFLLFSINSRVLSQSIFWATGSFYYLWPITFALFLLIPFFDMALRGQNGKIRYFPIYVVLAVAASMCMEQISLCLCASMAILILYAITKGNRPQAQHYILLAIAIVCTVIMVIAPGNAIRLVTETATHFPNFNELTTSEHFSTGISWMYEMLFSALFFTIVLLTIAALRCKQGEPTRRKWPAGLVWGMITLSVLALVFRGETIDFFFGFPQNASNLFGYIFWSVFLALLIYFLAKKGGFIYVVAFLAALCSLVMMWFSPTIYASGHRTLMVTAVIMTILTLALTKNQNHRIYIAIAFCAAAINMVNLALRFLTT